MAIERPSPNHDSRGGTPVDMLVLHYTGMENAEAALSRLCDYNAGVSAHYTIGEDGTVYAHVPEDSRAWHAGLSFWMGIAAMSMPAPSALHKIVNPGHEFGYRPFHRESQGIAALEKLRFAGTSWRAIPFRRPRCRNTGDIAPARKDDPGELFPWAELAADGIGLWPQISGGECGADGLTRFGYDPDVPLDKTITAFQRRFRPQKLNGMWDTECARLLAGLLALLPAPGL